MDAKDIFESVCHIKSQSENDGGQGTGFFMFLNGKNYIVSNKHVICGNKFTRTQITLSTSITNNETLESTTCTNKFPIVQELLIKSDMYDIALYPIDEVINDINKKGYNFNHYIIREEDILSKYDECDYIEDVIFVGYPSGFKDSKTNRPFTSHGITSTPISLPLEERDEFIISAASYKGSSGSPVFIKRDSSYKLVGVVSGSLKAQFSAYNINAMDNFIKQVNGEFNTNFSFCVKINTINALI